MTARPVVAVLYAETTSPVVLAQTPPLLRAWREAGRTVDAAVFTSPRALVFSGAKHAHAVALHLIAEAAGRRPMRRTHWPRDGRLPALGKKLAADLVKRELIGAVLLCRQPRAALVGIAARDALAAGGKGAPRVVLDLRGVRDDEYLMTLGKTEDQCTPAERKRVAAYRAQEESACRGADGVLTVSGPMERHVERRWGVPKERLAHVPNSARLVPHAEENRAAVRKELGVDARALLFVYSGTMAAWQLPDRCVLLFQALLLHAPDARLLFLTPQPDAAKKAVAATGAKNVIFRSAAPSEVGRTLCAADYGFLLREDATVNRVACPVKFGEYLAAGVRPILTPGIGDQSRLLGETDLGVVISLHDAPLAAKQVSIDIARPGAADEKGRARRRAWVEENIAPPRVAARIGAFVDRLGLPT